MERIVRCAQVEDTKKVISFLKEANLSADGVEEGIEYFLILENEKGDIHGTMGIEPLGKIGLLRSLALNRAVKEKELFLIFEQMLILARDKQLQNLYLATNKQTSLRFFSLLGFSEEQKDNLPKELFKSTHGKHLAAVDNSIFMRLNLY